MCPAHRSKKLASIRSLLKKGQACRLIATQLIEAGVDVDYPVVFRAAAGLDSIAQAAGRCNRESRLEKGNVYLFKPEKHGLPGGWFSRTADIARMVMRDFCDPLALPAIKQYFSYLYDLDNNQLDKEDIIRLIQENQTKLLFPFKKIASKFKLIDSVMIPVIISYNDEAEALLKEARFSRYHGNLERRLQPYTVQVFGYEFAELLRIAAHLKCISSTLASRVNPCATVK